MEHKVKVEVPVMADLAAMGKTPEYLFWVGCAGAFDDRYKKVAQSFARILAYLGTDYAVLGPEESCTGDPARRAGNEMLFQMQALINIETMNRYQVKKILTICPHCYNIFRNEYPDLGGHYEVIHYTSFLRDMAEAGRLGVDRMIFSDKRITFHDPCYLGRGNGEYEAPRSLLGLVNASTVEMGRNRSYALCCGAGGAQMFKEAEKGDKEVFMERTGEALNTGAGIIATSCPFCMTMMTDGIKYNNREADVINLDVAEIVAMALDL